MNIYGLSVIIISMICAILTIAVYLYVKILRNTLGKCIISYLFSMVVLHFICILSHFKLGNMYLDLPLVFFIIAYYTWPSVISYHCWQTFKPVKREEHRYQFLVYSAFVWISDAGLMALLIILDKFLLAFEHGLSFLSVLNFIMFTLTAINIWKVKREMKRFERQKDTTATSFNFNTQTYAMYLRISVIMGVTWIFGAINFFCNIDKSVFTINFRVHLCFGSIYFLLLVLKRSTLKLFMDSIRERRNEKQVRAQRKKDLAEIPIQRKNIVNANEVQLA